MNQNSRNEEGDPLLTKHSQSYNSLNTQTKQNDPEADAKLSETQVEILAPRKSFSWLGYVFCVFSGLCFIACNVCIKFASSASPVSSWQMLLVRCFVQKVCMVPVLCWKKENILGPPGDVKTKLRLAAQAIMSGCLLLCYFEGIRRLPLGDFGAIAFSSPAFTMVLSIFMLKEHCGVYRSMIGIILTVGVVMISRPPSLFPESSDPTSHGGENVTEAATAADKSEEASVDILGVVFALAGSALSAWVTIIARQLRHIHFSIQVFWFSLGGEVIAVLGMFLIDTSPLFSTWTVTTWLLSAGQGVLGLVGTVLILLALQWISPTKNKVIRSFQVIASYIIQVEVFGITPHITDYLGAMMIVMAVLGITMEDMVMKAVKQGDRYRYL